jgi:hypothetical protein
MYKGDPCDLNNGRGSRGNLGPSISGLTGDGASDGGTLQLTLGVNDDTSIVLKVQEGALRSAPSLTLTDDDTLHNCVRKDEYVRLCGQEDMIGS